MDMENETTEKVETSATDADGEIVVWIVTARCDGCRADAPGDKWRLSRDTPDFSETETTDGCAYRWLFDDPEKALECARFWEFDEWQTYIDTETIGADEWEAVCRPHDEMDIESDGFDFDNLADVAS